MSLAPFPIDPALTAIAVGYRNPEYIADLVLPRVTVALKPYKYLEYPLGEAFTLPDTLVGRKGAPNVVEFSATEKTGLCLDYGLDDEIPVDDINQAPANYNPVDHSVMSTTDMIMLDREQRAAAVVFNAANYANTITLSGTSQYNDFVNSDPIGDILAALDIPLMRPNVITLGREVFTKLRQHPKILKAVHGNSGDSGSATRRQLAEQFEVDEIIIGGSRINMNKKGQAVSLSRVWGKHIAMTYRNSIANTRSGITFGITAEYGTRISGRENDSKIGLRGGVRVRVGETVEEKVVAPDAGYFIQNAIL